MVWAALAALTANRSPLIPIGRTASAITALHEKYVAAWHDAYGSLPSIEFDAEWPSLCIVSEPSDGRCHWQPVPATPPIDLAGLGHALEVDLNPSWIELFATAWSATLKLSYSGAPFELLQLWNQQDAENLVGNQIGHALEKRRIHQPLSLFFGLIDDDRLLTVDNDSGRVELEVLGAFRPEEVCPDIVSFLERCEPDVS
ncbi:MAG: SecY-interacting protein Syd [Pseudomonadota bacterium]